MKKKLLTVVALMALVMIPTFAKSSDMSAGLAVGTINGVGFKYKVDKDITAGGTVGFDVFSGTINVEGFGLYKVAEVDVQKEVIDINVGLGGAARIPLSSSDVFGLSVLGMGEASYSFDGDLPIDLLLRLEPGVGMTFSGGFNAAFVMQASLQALWRF
ncbi:MAG: hypothetical protein PQJ45_05525 [Sphaerochaetaceae bacterium]|nr:hypothetical protein [Sphaerochaetaceae bacterium]MDC7237217.1 hypothetical protein [Sphaerochaetaceae bacterium]